MIDDQPEAREILAHLRVLDLVGQIVVLLEDEDGLGLGRKDAVESALEVLVNAHYHVSFGFGKLENLSEDLLVDEDPQLLLADLVEQPEVPVGPQPDERAHFVADILHCIVFGNLQLYRLAQSQHLDLYLLAPVLQLLQLFVGAVVVEEVASQLDIGSAEDGEHLLLLVPGEAGRPEAAGRDGLAHDEAFLVGRLGQLVEVVGQVEVVQEILGVLLDEFVVEELHEYLSDDDLAVLNGLGLVAVEPALPQALGLRDLQIALVIGLNHAHHLTHHREPSVQQLLDVSQLHLDDILGVLREGRAADFLRPDHLHNHLLPGLVGYLLERLVDLLSLVGVDFIGADSECHEAVGVNGDHISVYFVVFLSTGEEVLVDWDPFEDSSGLLLDDEQQVVADDEQHLFWFGLLDEGERELSEILPLLLEEGRILAAELLLELVEPHPPHDLVDLVVHLGEDSFEAGEHVGKQPVVWVAFAGVLDDRLEERLVTRYPEGGLAQLIVSYLVRILGVLPADLSHLLVTLLPLLQALLRSLRIQDVVSVQFEERNELFENGAVALVHAVVLVLLPQHCLHALVEVPDFYDGGEEQPFLLLADVGECTNGLLDHGDVLGESLYVPLLAVDQLANLHLPLLQPLQKFLPEFAPLAEKLQSEHILHNLLRLAQLPILLVYHSVHQHRVVPVQVLITTAQKLYMLAEVIHNRVDLSLLDAEQLSLPSQDLALLGPHIL